MDRNGTDSDFHILDTIHVQIIEPLFILPEPSCVFIHRRLKVCSDANGQEWAVNVQLIVATWSQFDQKI